jgi:hypothetical protein
MLTGGQTFLEFDWRFGRDWHPCQFSTQARSYAPGGELASMQERHRKRAKGATRRVRAPVEVSVPEHIGEYGGTVGVTGYSNGISFDTLPALSWRSGHTNGLSRPPKQLPYTLEASPSPVNRGYMGASSSWSGVNHAQNISANIGTAAIAMPNREMHVCPQKTLPHSNSRQKSGEIRAEAPVFCIPSCIRAHAHARLSAVLVWPAPGDAV